MPNNTSEAEIERAEITDADREAAIDIAHAYIGTGPKAAAEIVSRHRQQSEASLRAENEALRTSVAELLAPLEMAAAELRSKGYPPDEQAQAVFSRARNLIGASDEQG